MIAEKKPLVTITVPTLNSAKTLRRTLESIKKQTYKNCEIIVVDGFPGGPSTDKTLEIAKQYTDNVFPCRTKLLGARYVGVEKGKGEIHICLDSDQVLAEQTVEKAVKLMREKSFDMLFLEEDSYKPRTLIEKLTSIDRKSVHQKKIIQPELSVLLPRVFRKSLLKKVYDAIDHDLFDIVTFQDHAIIYYEAYKLSKKVGFLSNAVYHEEPSTILELFTHYFAWGKRVAQSPKLPVRYAAMFDKKLNSRTKSVQLMNYHFFLVAPILLIKGMGYYSGIFSTRFQH